ncbi:MAG TPA: hypothetical protein VMZ49_10485 [Patescibacteria group bacterium]|nr:hypothetical protein [Patescibacteria group bacterium]
MNKMAVHGWILTVLLFVVLHSGCNQQQEEIPQGKLTNQSGCKKFAAGLASSIVPANEQECIRYRYSENTLYLSHQNTAFNCCPGKIMTAITVSNHTITIREIEQEAGCHCMCLFDLEMEICNLPRGTYRIMVNAPYLGGQTALDFICDLELKSAGEYCLDRNGYPWETAGE